MTEHTNDEPEYQDEVRFVLDLIKDEWPGGWPDTIHRIHRSDSLVLETGNRRRKAGAYPSVNVISAALADQPFEPRGTEYDHNVETVVSCRAVAQHAAENGQIHDFNEWKGFTNRIKEALTTDRTYPDVMSDADDLGWVCYQDLRVEQWTDLSNEYRDQYRLEWDVRLTGVEELPEQ